MAKRMLIDATHSEETRVVVVNGNRLEEFDVETSTKQQLKGNIYLAKIVRVEPSLQAAFVDYGAGRHGFLAFSEIHPDYYQIPIADRQALLEAQRQIINDKASAVADFDDIEETPQMIATEVSEVEKTYPEDVIETVIPYADNEGPFHNDMVSDDFSQTSDHAHEVPSEAPIDLGDVRVELSDSQIEPMKSETDKSDEHTSYERRYNKVLRGYKIQEVIKRRQIILVQVVKEERGNKGAALTTYLSLAGRYCVLMPNTARGGGVSRKITNINDRKRLKEVVNELDIPEVMAVIVRTAGSERTKPEIRRDYEYLLRLWDSIRDLTLQSTAPKLVYEEADLIKRSIRDLYARDVDEILVEGEEGYRQAKDFMRMLTPSHARKVQLFKEPGCPLFHKYNVESQLDAMHNPVVQLRSGGYLVINQTEALVAIDVNSGRATRERHIEETAIKTNCEAADEIARQLRLRDLAGLIVIDFIDMEDGRNNYAVERRLKEAMRFDRARIQVGRISTFGLLELSRQRLRPSLLESSFQPCIHCNGTGIVRSIESASIHVLRAIEEEGVKARSSEVTITTHPDIALYIFNHKRKDLVTIENQYRFKVLIQSDLSMVPPAFRMDRVKQENIPEPLLHTTPDSPKISEDISEVMDLSEQDSSVESEIQQNETNEANRRRRRRRRRGKREDTVKSLESKDDNSSETVSLEVNSEGNTESQEDSSEGNMDKNTTRRHRGRRHRGRRLDENVETVEIIPESNSPQEDLSSIVHKQEDKILEEKKPKTTRTRKPKKIETDVSPQEVTVESPIKTPKRPRKITKEKEIAEGSTEPEISQINNPETPPRKGWWNRFI